MKPQILQFIDEYFSKKEKAPSIRTILSKFKKEQISFNTFYQLFPGGIAEACELANIPVPTSNLDKTTSANAANKAKHLDKRSQENIESEAENDSSQVLVPDHITRMNIVKERLVEQLPRVYGIPSKEPKLINAISDTLNPNITSDPELLHIHIKGFAPRVNDRHLEVIILKIFEHLENEGYWTSPGRRYEPNYGRRSMVRGYAYPQRRRHIENGPSYPPRRDDNYVWYGREDYGPYGRDRDPTLRERIIQKDMNLRVPKEWRQNELDRLTNLTNMVNQLSQDIPKLIRESMKSKTQY